MFDDLAQIAAAATWLVPAEAAPWHWDESCEAIVWEDGTTIVFREELAQIVDRFATRGLPRNGALMLLLAACRGKVPSISAPGVESLQFLASLPAALKSGVPARASLALHFLHERDKTTASVDAVVKALRSDLLFADMLELDDREVADQLRGDLASIYSQLKTLDRKAIEMLLTTGVAQVPDPAPELELPLSVQIGNLLTHLLADPQVAGVARVAQQLMAAISLPETLSRAQDDAVGGVSDIGNRGPLHRLLLSELAHDDDTLAIRLALNEALYTRREPAATHPPSRLVILIDVGLRMWGTPRILAVAAALAFLAKAGKRVHPLVFRSAADDAVPLKIWTENGIVELLGSLDSRIDASAALADLLGRIETGGANVDLVVVTHRSTLDDRSFVERLPTGGVNSYAVGINREGIVSIFSRGPRGLRPMNEVRIDPRTLFSTGGAESSLRDGSRDLPAIFRIEPFPFLLPPDGAVEYGWSMGEGGGVCLTNDGAIWCWNGARRGALRLPAPNLRGRTVGLLHSKPENCWVAVKHHAHDGELHVARWFVDRGTGKDSVETTLIQSDKGLALHAFTRAGYLYVVFRDHAEVISLGTGESVGKGSFPSFARVIGTRFLDLSLSNRKVEFGIFYWDGSDLSITTLRPARELKDTVVLMFDRAGFEMPWVVDQEGRIFEISSPAEFSPATGRVIRAETSPSGHRVWMRLNGSQAKMATLDRHSISWSWSPSQSPQRFFDGFAEPPRWTVRSKFTHVGISPAGSLMLRSHKGHYVEITFGMDEKFQFVLHKGKVSVVQVLPFREWAGPPGMSISMRYVEWPDGSRVFLDERGLLHLQSSSTILPEVTFVLAESTSMPAWASDGRKIGPPYFIDDHIPGANDAAIIAGYVQQFANVIL